MHSEHACNVGPLINQEIFLGCTKGRVRVTEEIVMQQQGNDDRDGDDASYDTCMLMMTDVNVIHASIRYGNSSQAMLKGAAMMLPTKFGTHLRGT